MNEREYDALCKRLLAERFAVPQPRKPRQPPRNGGNRALWAATNEARPLSTR
jgi:hypothetical protein